MARLQFTFKLLESSDGKSNIFCVTQITTPDGKIFRIPHKYLNANSHVNLMKMPEAIKSKNALKKRNQVRNSWVNLNETLKNDYIDESGNIFFKDEILEEICSTDKAEDIPITKDDLADLLLKLSEKTEAKNLKRIAEKFTLEKFSAKNNNAIQWLEIFESECARFDIERDADKIEIFRIFLEGSAADWYGSMLLRNTLHSEWKIWKENFKCTFIDKGWASIRFALTYRYIKGSLLDYALKKEKILLETNKNMDTTTLINLIATGLPNFIADRIDRGDLKVTEDLFNELRSLEHLTKKTDNRKEILKPKPTGKPEKKPCTL